MYTQTSPPMLCELCLACYKFCILGQFCSTGVANPGRDLWGCLHARGPRSLLHRFHLFFLVPCSFVGSLSRSPPCSVPSLSCSLIPLFSSLPLRSSKPLWPTSASSTPKVVLCLAVSTCCVRWCMASHVRAVHFVLLQALLHRNGGNHFLLHVLQGRCFCQCWIPLRSHPPASQTVSFY